MTTKKVRGTKPARSRATMTPGDMVRVGREMQEWTQADLAAASGLTQAAISGIEKGRIALGVERATRIARALRVHPAVLLFPNWDIEREALEPSVSRAR